MSADFTIRDEGTLVLLTPNTDEAKDWIREHLDDSGPWSGSTAVIGHRYVGDILRGIDDAGLTAE